MNKMELHGREVRRVAGRLRRLGHEVAPAPARGGADLIVDGSTLVAVRAATLQPLVHRVRYKGRVYEYRHYRGWALNWHTHGRLRLRADVYVAAMERRGTVVYYVIPRAAITAATWQLHDGRKPYRGRYARYREAWDVVAAAGRRRRAA